MPIRVVFSKHASQCCAIIVRRRSAKNVRHMAAVGLADAISSPGLIRMRCKSAVAGAMLAAALATPHGGSGYRIGVT
jgi:hypothetical protein